MAGKKEIPREISIYINDVQVVNSFTGINRAIAQTNNEIKNLNKNSETYDADLKRHQTTLRGLKESQAEFKEEINDTNVGAGKAKEAFSKMFVGLASGDLATAKEGFNEIKGSIGGMVKSALAFIATPLGAAIAVLSGTKAIFDFNVEAEKSAVLIENLSGKTGQVVEDIRVKMQSMTDTFGLSFDQLAAAVDNLVDTGVAKDELEALNKIKNGLLTAPDKNEFIGGLESTAVIAKQLGMDLEDVISLKQQIETTGVNPEATFGALEKATQRLQLGADGLRKKMSEALGAGFTDDVLAKVTTGQISVTKALELINTKSKEVGLNQTQQAELGKELFGKGAIAAGGYAVVLDTVAESIKKQKQPLNETQKALGDLETASTRYGNAQSELFRIKDFSSIWTNIKSSAIDALSSMLEWIIDVKKDIQPLIDFVGVVFVNAWIGLKTNIQTAFDVIGGVLKAFSLYISTAFNFIIKLIHGDFAGALNVLKNGFIKLGNIVEDTFGKIKNHIIDGLKSIVDNMTPFLEAIGLDVDKIQKKLNSVKYVHKLTPEEIAELQKKHELEKAERVKAETANTKATADELAKQKALRDAAHQKEVDAHQKELDKKKAAQEKHDKELWDKAIALAKAKTDLAKAELDYFISNNRSKLDSDKQLTPEIIAEETKRLDEIKFQQENALAEKRLSDIAKAEQEAKSAEELVLLKKAIDLEYLASEQNLEFQFLESTTALKKQYEEQQKQLAAEKLQFENDAAIADAQTKDTAELLRKQQNFNAEKTKFLDLYNNKKITEKQYNSFVKASEKELTEFKKQQELNKVNASLNAMNSLANALGELFGQSKELAIGQALINGALAVTSVLAAPSSGNLILDGVLKAVQIAAAVISTTAQIKKITSTKAPPTPKFFYGGFNNSDGSGGSTGTTAHLGHDEFGKITGVTHDEEWIAPKIMTQSPKYAATFSWLENERKGITGNKFFNGGESSSGTVAPFVANDNAILDALNRSSTVIDKLNNHLDNGIKASTVIGYKEAKEIKTLNDEREMSNNYGIVSK